MPHPAGGRRIGRYLVTGRIGRGGMGMVYRGYDPGLDREVAIKTLTLEANLEAEHRKRFEIEARAAAKLQHPNIVTVFELGDDRGVPFIAMELLPGADLEMLLRSGESLLLQEQLDVVAQVCRGLHYAHERKVVHRDIKPSNIRVLEDGGVKIMDFGIAKLAGSAVTQSGMLVGTVNYMSPEQVMGHPLDGRSDLFSVGVILYELLAGCRPFVADNSTQVLYKIVHEPIPPLYPEGLGEQGPALQDLLTRVLAKDPGTRPATAARLADELSRILAAHARSASGHASPEVMDTVNQSRRLLQEGRVDESVQRLREVTALHPQSLEARRALRWANREIERRTAQPVGPDEFSDLDAKFHSAPTRREPDTLLQPRLEEAPTARGSARGPWLEGRRLWMAAGGLGLVVVVLVVLWLLRRPPPAPASPGVASVTATSTGVVPAAGPPAVPSPVASAAAAGLSTVLVNSVPAGAAVSLDGRPLPGLTPLRVPLDPRVDHRLTVSREGYAPQEARVAAGLVSHELRLTLEKALPPGRVAVIAGYPVDVLWKGKLLAKEQATAEVSLPAGRQVVTLSAPRYFLNLSLPVEVRADQPASVAAPALGTLNIRAQPDNCRVFVDGIFVDYPPILNRAVAAGSHTVAFEWPGGVRRQQAVEVQPRSPAYVMGRKD